MNSQPLLSIIVPVYNEEKTLVSIMQRLTKALPDAEIIYINDGSRDGSLVLLKANARTQDRIVHKANGGKGSAVREGLKYARGMFTIVQDADLEYDPEDIPHLLREAQEKNLQALFGSRRMQKQEKQHSGYLYYIGGNLLSSLTNLLFGTHLTDVMTCYKLIRTDIFQSLPLTANGFALEVDIAGNLAKRGVKIPETGIHYHPRSRKEGKKITWKDFVQCLVMLVQIRLSK